MSDLENLSSPSPAPTLGTLEHELRALRKLFVVALAVLLVIGASVAIFLWGQKRILNGQLRDAQKFVADYERVTAPFLSNFINNLQTYGRTHPDFVPILDKYNLRPTTTNTASKAAAPALPATAPKTPKK